MYTYEDWEKAAKASGYYNEFSDADLKLAQENPDAGMSILSGKQDWHTATTDEQRSKIHDQTDAVRRSNGGYAGGGDGSRYYLTSPATYNDPYKPTVDELADTIKNYDYTQFLGTDEYGALRGQYERQGQRAMQNTLGEAAARTGGLASSYAVTAGQQAYGNQMNNLEAAALEMYANKKNDLYKQVGMYQGLSGTGYGRYQDRIQQLNTDRQFDYNSQQTAAANALEKQRYDQTQAEKSAGLNEAAGNYSGYVKAGLMTQAEADQMQKVWALQNPSIAAKLYTAQYGYLATLASAAGGGSSGRSGGTRSSGRKSSGGTKSSGGSGSKSAGTGGERNNSYIFNQVYAKLDNGWDTVQLSKALDAQHAAGKISDYEWEQANKAISVRAGSQRRHS